MCATRVQEVLNMQKQLKRASQKISQLQKQLEIANVKTASAFSPIIPPRSVELKDYIAQGKVRTNNILHMLPVSPSL